jgi:UDP-glucuronate decarboxylase
MASPVDYQKNPIATLLANSIGTYNIINLALRNNSRLLFTSTSEVYGDPKENPQKEEYWGNVNPIGIRSCYDEGKRFSEALLMAHKREKNLNLALVRIFNTYGPRMRKNDGRVVSNFIIQALRNTPITVYGSGKQTRSFCYVSDMVNGLIKMMDSEEVGPINLGNPRENKIIDIAKMVIKFTNSKSGIVFSKLPEDDPMKRRPDISKAKEKLDWVPIMSLEDGLKRTINYFSSLH